MRRSVTFSLVPWLVTLLVSTPSPGQEPTQPSEHTEEVTVRLVQVPITAKNRHGNPITDLTAAEIRVKDRGKKMKVAFLDPFVRPAIDEPLPRTRMFIDVPGGWHAVSEPTATEPRYMAIVVDVENDPKLQRDKALQDTLRFVHERMTPETRVSVFSFTGELNQELLFTPNIEAISSAIESAYSRSGRPDVDLGRRMKNFIRTIQGCVTEQKGFVSSADELCLRTTAIEYADERRPRAEEYLHALDGLLRMMGGIQGRKVVYALSHGVAVDTTTEIAEAMRAVLGNTSQIGNIIQYLSGESARLQMDRLLDLAMRERVAVNFVDRSSTPTGDFQASLHETYQPGARPMHVAHTAAQQDLKEIAATTGGSFIAEPDVFEGLSQAVNLEAGMYVLGYYVDQFLPPDRLRKISISAERRGVRIDHRRGYYDRPMVSDIVGKMLLGKVRDAKPDPSDEDGRSENSFVPFQVVIDPGGLQYEEAGDSMTANFTLHIQIETANGRIAGDGFRFVNHAYPLTNWESGDVELIRINGWVEVPAGRYRLIALVRSPVSGRQGEMSQIIDIPAREPGS